MICNNCGAQNVPGARFCTKCGTPMNAAPEQNYQQAPQQPYQSPYQQVYQQPYQRPYQNPYQTVQQPAHGLAIASLIMGIISLIFFAIIAGPLGIIFGGVAKSKGNTSPMATAGIVCGVIGVISWFILVVFMGDIIGNIMGSLY